MGMFDTIRIKCPKCGNYIEEQSKAGDCLLNTYDLEEAPVALIQDVSGIEYECNSCKCKLIVLSEIKVDVKVKVIE